MKNTKSTFVNKIIVAGCRDYDNYTFVKENLDAITVNLHLIEIVSGGCSDSEKGIHTYTRKDGSKVYGVDGLGERWAEENKHPVRVFPANWEAYGRSAGPIRNKKMSQYGGYLVAFWNMHSKGTKNMVELAVQFNLLLRIISI